MVHTHLLTTSLWLLQPPSHIAHNGHAAGYIVSPLYTASQHIQRGVCYYILENIHVAQMKCCVLYHLKVVRGWWASHYFGGNGFEVTGVHTWQYDMIMVWASNEQKSITSQGLYIKVKTTWPHCVVRHMNACLLYMHTTSTAHDVSILFLVDENWTTTL